MPSLAHAGPFGAVQLGAQSTDIVRDDGADEQASGPLLDGELGWRARGVVASAFAAYSTTHTQYSVGIGDAYEDTYKRDHTFYDVGLRARIELGPRAFAGAGLAIERIAEHGTLQHVHGLPPMPPTIMPIDEQDTGVAAELAFGYTVARFASDACGVQIVAAVTRTFDTGSISATSARFALGVELR